MKWTRRFFGETPRDANPEDDDMQHQQKEQALQALANAQEGLAQAELRGPEVSRIASSLRAMRQRNHFAETIQRTFREST